MSKETLKQRLADAKANPQPRRFSAETPLDMADTQQLLTMAEVLRLQAELKALREAKAELLSALADVLRTGLNGGNNVRLSFMAASRDVLSKEDLARAEASEDAVIKARAAIAKYGGKDE